MATRLYPSTTDRAVLARLAGVPETTWGRLDQLNQAEQSRESWSSQRDLYRESPPDEEVLRLETFVVFGWGRADFRALQKTGLDPSCDATQNLEQVKRLITAHGVDLHGVDVAELGASTGVKRLRSAPELGAEKHERKEAEVAKHQELTPRHKLPKGHQPRRHSLVLRDKRHRRAKDRLRRELD